MKQIISYAVSCSFLIYFSKLTIITTPNVLKGTHHQNNHMVHSELSRHNSVSTIIHVTLQNGAKCPINMYDVHFESLVRGTVGLILVLRSLGEQTGYQFEGTQSFVVSVLFFLLLVHLDS